MRIATSGLWVWEEQHLGVECASTPHEFSVLRLRLNSCSAPDASSTRYHKFSCKLGDFKSSVLRQDYDDASCASEHGSPYLQDHAFYCRADPRTGAYVKTQCGDFSPKEVKNKAQLLLKWYPATSKKKAPVCLATEAVTRILLLDRCLPQTRVFSKDKGATYYYTLSYSSSTAASITLTERRYGKEDKRCKGSVFLTRTVQYSRTVTAGPSGCASDPVSPALGGYAAALYHDGSASSWAGLLHFIRGTTPEPSAIPTASPVLNAA